MFEGTRLTFARYARDKATKHSLSDAKSLASSTRKLVKGVQSALKTASALSQAGDIHSNGAEFVTIAGRECLTSDQGSLSQDQGRTGESEKRHQSSSVRIRRTKRLPGAPPLKSSAGLGHEAASRRGAAHRIPHSCAWDYQKKISVIFVTTTVALTGYDDQPYGPSTREIAAVSRLAGIWDQKFSGGGV